MAPHLLLILCVIGLSFSAEPKEWIDGGTAVVTASKTTYGNSVRLEIEAILPVSAVVVWKVDSVVIEANARELGAGTSRRTADGRTLFTLDTKMSDRMVYFVVVVDDFAATYEIDVSGKDRKTFYNDPMTCQASFSNSIEQNTVEAFFRCNPELKPEDFWYMFTGMVGSRENIFAEFISLDSEANPYVNVSYEHSKIARSTISITKETRDLFGNFLFLFSSLTVPMDGLIEQVTYRITHDISENKIPGEFRFMENPPLSDLLEGEPLSIICEAIGRNPPTIQIQKNNRPFPKSEVTSSVQSVSTSWSTTIASFSHALEQIKGKYSCVATDIDGNLRSSKLIEVKLRPRFRPDLSAVIENEATKKHVLVVVEGAKGVSVVCSGNSWPTEGVEVSTDRASLSEWNERLEVNFKWMTPNGDDNLFQYTPIVSCTAVDKHGETTVEKAL
ncbi:uncharacterized protein [Magallana gigas]|uniref:uncharacterized protein n=1 Tax=Magallana gigas TaxID=29159 RepID=UPI00333F409F